MTNTVDHYLKRGSFEDGSGNTRLFISREKGWLYSISQDPSTIGGSKSQQIEIGTVSFHKYLGGVRGVMDLGSLLGDVEASESDISRIKEKEKSIWESKSFEDQRQLVQFAYNLGDCVPQEDIEKYNIETD